MPVPAWKTWTALGLVYVVWGSTYLAIRYVVEDLPPILSAATRFAVAALLLAAWVAVRRGRAPFRNSARQWAGAATVGLLLLLGFCLAGISLAHTLWAARPLAMPARFVVLGIAGLLATALLGNVFALALSGVLGGDLPLALLLNGVPLHAAFGLGLEPMLLLLTGMQNIRDVIPFPRTPKNAAF